MVATTRLVIALVAVLLAAGPVVATEQPDGSPLLDTAAMVLSHDDLPRSGFGFVSGRTVGVEELAELRLGYTGAPPATVLEALRSAGFRRGYASDLALPRQPEGGYGVIATSYVLQFADPEGAAEGFVLLEDDETVTASSYVLAVEDVVGTRRFGDESEMTRVIGITDDSKFNVRYATLALSFRRGNLYAGVSVTSLFWGELGTPVPAMQSTFSLAEVEELAAVLERRIARVRGGDGPRLGVEALRLAGQDVLPVADEYRWREGRPVPRYGEPIAEPEGGTPVAETRAPSHGSATDVYVVGQRIGWGPLYQAVLFDFPTEEAASNWLSRTPQLFAESSVHYVDVEPVTLDPIGDGSLALSYGFKVRAAETERGHVIYARAGTTVASVQATDQAGVPIEVVAELAASQIDCLRAGTCEPVEVPAALASLAQLTAALLAGATPAA